MIRSPLLHELLALSLLGAGVVWGASVIYSQEGRTATADAASQEVSPAPAVPPAPAMVISNIRLDGDDPIQRRIFADYGAVFVTQNGAVPPPKVIFGDDKEVDAWQSSVPTRRERLGRYEVEL